MIRLDITKEISSYKQLDLFSGSHPTPEGEGLGGRCPNNGTAHVPNLTDTSPIISTPQVPNVGHLIKPNIIKQRETPTHEIFKRNKKIQNAVNDMAGVPKLIPESLNEVEELFKQNNYPVAEAKKFFNHYKAIGWKIQGVTPIEDWKALSEKWMANAAKWDDKKQQPQNTNPTRDIQYLYETFLEGKKIFHQITPDHFDQLKLELTDETMQQARQERINEVAGTNQHSINLIWEAYLTNDPINPIVTKDKPNLIALAKRIEVLKHFQQQKQSGTNSLTIKSK